MSWLREKSNDENKNIKFFIHDENKNAVDVRDILWEKCRESKIKPEVLTSPIIDSETGEFLEVATLEITSENGKADTARGIIKELLNI